MGRYTLTSCCQLRTSNVQQIVMQPVQSKNVYIILAQSYRYLLIDAEILEPLTTSGWHVYLLDPSQDTRPVDIWVYITAPLG